MPHKELRLKVVESAQDDVNKGVVRIDTNFLHDADLRPGDIVEIEGEKKTVAIVDRAYPGDIGLGIIRMDGIIRRNAKTGIGEVVKVRKAEFREAKKVIIAPAPTRKGIIIRANPEIFKQGLLGRALTKEDIVSMGGSKRRRSATSSTPNPFFDEIFSALDDNFSGFGLGDIKFIVVDTLPKDYVVVTEETEIVFNPEPVEMKEEKIPEFTYEDVGGLEDEIKKIREMVELPLKHPEIFERLGIEPPKGVLLHGPPGTGKTLLAKAVANETNSNFILINGPEIMSKYYGQSEENLRKKFEDAEKKAPSIIFIDEIDAIAINREESKGEVERRVVATLLALMDGLKSRGRVIVMGATNIPNSLDPALRRPGRFDRELELNAPDKVGRLQILKIHTRTMPIDTRFASLGVKIDNNVVQTRLLTALSKIAETELLRIATQKIKIEKQKEVKKQFVEYFKVFLESELQELPTIFKENLYNKIADHFIIVIEEKSDSETLIHNITERKHQLIDGGKINDIISISIKDAILRDIAEVTHGFVGADLASLAKEAAMILLRRILPDLRLKSDEPIPKDILDKLFITQQDFIESLKVVRPSALREVLIEIPNINYSDIGGLEEVKQELMEAIEWPLKHPESFQRMGVKPPKGVLIYGPPGTGKTLLAKAVAHESQANFILVKGPELLSKWVGESEKAIRKIFDKARQTSPTIIFFDEIDSIAPRRSGSDEGSHVTERVVNQLLTEMDGLEELHNVVIIAATNRPDILDTALLRPGRFDRIILTPGPDEKSRLEIFKVHTKNMPLKGVKIQELAEKTQGYAGADIEAICREAAILALREDINAKEVKIKHFELALDKVRPSLTPEIEEAYKNLENFFRSAKGKQMATERPIYMG